MLISRSSQLAAGCHRGAAFERLCRLAWSRRARQRLHGAPGGCNSKSPRSGSREHVLSKQAVPELIALAPKGMTTDSSRSATKGIVAMNAFAIAPPRTLHEILRAAMNSACHSGHLDMTGWCGESFSHFSVVNTNARQFCPFSGPERNSSMRQLQNPAISDTPGPNSPRSAALNRPRVFRRAPGLGQAALARPDC